MDSIWRPYTQEFTARASTPLDRANGAYLHAKNGLKIFDGISSWWLITHGHCHAAISEAIAAQASRLDQVAFANFTHEPAEELAELLIQHASKPLSKIFFSDNGSTAVEVALKMSIQACAQRGKLDRTKFIAFESSYHGDTVGAMSVSGDSAFNAPYRRNLFEVLRAKHPKRSTEPVEEWTRDFERLLNIHHRQIAGVIIEPLLQGAAGMIVWPLEAVRRIVNLCREFGVLVIFDEVMTGFGRTGAMFAMERLNVVPDFVCLSKGLTGGSLPLAATLTTDEIYEAFRSKDRSKMFFHGHSFTGNPISCAAAVANLKIFKQEKTIEKISEVCRWQTEFLQDLSNRIEIRDPRYCGTIAAFEIGDGDYLNGGRDVSIQALDRGVFLRTLGDTLYLMPPYCASKADLQNAWAVVESCIIGLL